MRKAKHAAPGFLVEGQIVALRPVTVHPDDRVLQEYGASPRQARRAYRAVVADVKAAKKTGQTKPFTGK